MLEEFSDVLSDVPGLTTLGVHQIKLTSDQPDQAITIHVKRHCDEVHVRKMVKAGVIEPSYSPYCFPIVIVKKKHFVLILEQ